MAKLKAGLGRRRPQLDIPIDRLHPDSKNPRLPRDLQDKGEQEIIEAMYRFFNLQEIAISMYENGYFDAEPLVAIPQDLPGEFKDRTYDDLTNDESYGQLLENQQTNFVVVEGNRRLCSAKLLLLRSKKNFPVLDDDEIEDDLKVLPVIVYPDRKDVLAYLGARHIIGTRKWDAYAKARYIASLKEDHGLSMDDIQRTVGDTGNSARKIYASYRLLEQIEQEYENLDTTEAKENFSFLILSTGLGPVKEYVGLAKKWDDVNFDQDIIPQGKVEKLRNLFSWLFGEGADKRRVIKESRDITNYLTPTLRNPEATKFLEETGDLPSAFDRSDGEKSLVKNYIIKANSNLEKSLQMLHRHGLDQDVVEELKKLQNTLETALKIIANV